MIYLIISEDNFSITQELNNIITNNKDSEIIKYDLLETKLDTVIETLDTYNFFSNKKIVVCENPTFITNEQNKLITDNDLLKLENYLNNPSKENILIFIVKTKLDERKKLTKKIKEVSAILDKPLNINSYIKNHLEDYKMDLKTIDYLIRHCKDNKDRIINEFEKLKLFKYDNKIIDINDINNYVTKTMDDNIFDLIDSIIKKDKKKALQIYEELISQNEEPIKILVLIANKFRTLYQIKVLSKKGLNNDDIAKKLSLHPYTVKLSKEMALNYSETEILNNLLKLSQIDYDIKVGNTFNNISLELFIIEL
ncbi:MAG: DNA polymerase III subunit delta [Bacilli bacterium]|nr:DNA polymerase III subunit delta [Bacilli bacterium]